MAKDIPIADFTLITAADLSTKQHYLIKVDSNGKAALASAAGEAVIGVLQNKPGSGEAAQVRCQPGAVTRCIAGGTVTAGNRIKTDSGGKGVAAQASYVNTSDAGAAQDPVVGSYVIGIALESAASNEYFDLMITLEGAIPTTAA